MSGDYDSDKPEVDIDVDVDNDESTIHQDSGSREANSDSNNSNDDGVMVSTDINGSGGDSDGVVVSEDAGREDMFEDAPEDLGADGRDSSGNFTETHGSTDGEEEHPTRFRGLDNDMQNDYMVDEMERLKAMLDKTLNEKESIAREYKDEMEMAAKGIANLRHQVRDLISKQLSPDQSNLGPPVHLPGDPESVPLHEMIHECSVFLRSVSDEIQDLNRKSAEVSVSHEVVNSYMTSVQNESAEVQFQKDQYMEEITNRLLSSLVSVVYVGDLPDSSVPGKIAHIERGVFSLIENYNWFLYQSDQLRQCLIEVRPDLAEQGDYGIIFGAANEELRGFRSKEADFIEKLRHLEDENKKMIEQLDQHKSIADTANTELERFRAELEQEKHRYSNTKEKLSMAVTKGKALVQQRDSLKQALADKTSELENCLVQLQEKSSQLDAAELIKEELVNSQISGASLQELLAQKDLVLEKIDDIVFQSGVPEGLRSKDITERIRLLVDERNALKDVSLKFHQLADVLLSIDLPENFSFSDLESRLGWLRESYDQTKAEIGNLQDEISRTGALLQEAKSEIVVLQSENDRFRQTAHSEMDSLTAVLSTVLVEKDYISMELEDTNHRFEAIMQREHQASTEKERMLRILQEASGLTVTEIEPSGTLELVERCLSAMKERISSSHEALAVKPELLQSLQSLLFIKYQELALYESLGDEIQRNQADLENLSTDLRRASEELVVLREEKETLQKDLERAEDKNAVIREKLSMAVKKGKGLVQDRENLKQSIDEKSSEIEKLKLELQEKEVAISNYENETSRLSSEVQGISKLEEDLLALKEQRNQLQSDLLDSNNSLNTLLESINNIVTPINSEVEEPIEKLRWLAEYLSGCQIAKAQAEQQLEKATAEVDTLTSKVSEGHSIIKSLEDAVTAAEEKISELSEEKSEIVAGHASIQEQLQRAAEEASLLAEANAAKLSLESALSTAEINISRLDKEKDEAESGREAAEAELEKARAEISDLTSKLSEAMANMKDVEDKVSHLESRISQLTSEDNEAQIGRTNIETELKKLKEDADTWDIKLKDAYSTIESLEKALAKAENGISELANEKKAAEQEVSTLNAKLNACMEELTGTNGSLESRSLEIFDHLKDLKLLGRDDSFTLSSLRGSLETIVESLKEMDHTFRTIRGQLAEMNVEHIDQEELSCLGKLLSTSFDHIVDAYSVSSEPDAVEADDISLYVQKIVESFNLRKKTSDEKVNGFFSFLNECNASVLQELHSISNMVTPVVEKVKCLNQNMKNLETDYQTMANRVATLEDDTAVLLSTCTEAAQVLQFEVDRQMPEISLVPDFEAEYQSKVSHSKHGETLDKLVIAVRKLCRVSEMLKKSKDMHSSTTEEMQSKLNELNLKSERTMEERDKCIEKIHVLETDLAEKENMCSEQRMMLEQYQDVEINLRYKEEEIASLQNTLTIKDREAGEAFVLASHLKSLLEKADGIHIPVKDALADNLDPQDSVRLMKLLHVIDGLPELQHQLKCLSQEKEELQTALASQLDEIEQLKVQVQENTQHEQELAEVRNKILDIETGLDGIIRRFAPGDITGDLKSASTNDLLQSLENLVMTVSTESENLKSRVHELQSKAEKSIIFEKEAMKIKGQLLELEEGMQRIIQNLGGDVTGDPKLVSTDNLVQVLEMLVGEVMSDSQNLKSTTRELDLEGVKNIKNEQELASVKGRLVDLEGSLQSIILKLKGDLSGDQKPIADSDLVPVLERMVSAKVLESEISKSRVQELDLKLLGSQKAVDELLSKVKMLEDSLQSRAVSPKAVQEKSMFESPSQPSPSEISEIEDVGSASKPTISPVPSSAHVRSMRKGSSDFVAVNIESESSRLIDKEDAVEDKGHVFKSLNTSGLVPIQGKIVADRIDGIWVSSDRLLRSRPGARLSLIAYWLLVHLWLLGTIL